MGITTAALTILIDMQLKKLFANKQLKIIEFGSQDVHCQNDVVIDGLYDCFGVSPEQRKHVSNGSAGRILFECLGFDYECIDLDRMDKTLAWDINTAQCPEAFREQFVLTTNHGTTEHLIGQNNAFRLMHDLTAVGGFMMHTVPCTGQVNHGFFSYSPILFYSLARVNAYDINYFLLTDFENMISYQDFFSALPEFSYIITVMQKTSSQPYQSPMQVWDRDSLCYLESLKACPCKGQQR